MVVTSATPVLTANIKNPEKEEEEEDEESEDDWEEVEGKIS